MLCKDVRLLKSTYLKADLFLVCDRFDCVCVLQGLWAVGLPCYVTRATMRETYVSNLKWTSTIFFVCCVFRVDHDVSFTSFVCICMCIYVCVYRQPPAAIFIPYAHARKQPSYSPGNIFVTSIVGLMEACIRFISVVSQYPTRR